MYVGKAVTINLGQYQSLKLSVENAPDFESCDKAIIAELQRVQLPVNSRIKQILQWTEKGLNEWI